MKIGPNCGESLPFAERIAHKYDRYYLGWGDRTYGFNTGGEVPIHLGDYIGALATEFRLLNNNALNTQRTEYELALALNAFERIDKTAEYYTSQMFNYNFYDTSHCASSDESFLNGYFIRDDIPYRKFIPENLSHFNRPGSLTKLKGGENNTQSALDRYEFLNPSHSEYWYRAGWKNKCVPHEESKDGTINLSMGFALTSKLLGSSPLAYKAKANLQRMVEYVHDGSKPGSPGYPHTPWSIINPVSEKCVFGDGWKNNPCDGGGLYLECSYGAAVANEKWGIPRSGLVASTAPYTAIYQFSQYIYAKDYNFYGNFAALDNNWYFITPTFYPFFPVSIFLSPFSPSLGMFVNTTWTRMKQFAKAKDEGQPHLPYLYRV